MQISKVMLTHFRKEFEHQIDKKPSWGQKEVKELFIITMNNVLLENMEYNNKSDKQNEQ